jgi:hypothetical protein
MSLLRISWAPAVAALAASGALALLCGAAASNLIPPALAYALLVLP